MLPAAQSRSARSPARSRRTFLKTTGAETVAAAGSATASTW
ncbi:twin-arginine translocation signal domain-containing protein [Kineococcus sp. R86509]